MPRRGEMTARTKAICDAYERALKTVDPREARAMVAQQFNLKSANVLNTLVRSGKVQRTNREVERASRYRGVDEYQKSAASVKQETAPRAVMREPCSRCGVRADVGCKHQPPSGLPAPTYDAPVDRRNQDNGQGLSFHLKKLNLNDAIARLKPITKT